jgi:hypothetical protein
VWWGVGSTVVEVDGLDMAREFICVEVRK